MVAWTAVLDGDPLPWLLSEEAPAVRASALRLLLDLPGDAPEVHQARQAAMAAHPIAEILAAQHPEGYWTKPGSGYGPKYRGTVWSLIFLDQMGADPDNPQVRAACEYVLAHCSTDSGGFGLSAALAAKPLPSTAAHCLQGNLLRALIGFGCMDDDRVQLAIDWAARAATGEGGIRYYKSATSGPGFACAVNDGLPCAWGAVKEMLALARVPAPLRTPLIQAAVEAGVELLLSRDPAVADYPMGYGNTKPNSSWFKLGFPIGYVTDVLQNLQAMCELGYGGDPRLGAALRWLLSKQDAQGRWKNGYAYNGKTWSDVEQQGQPSRWVTLRACHELKMATEQGWEPGRG